jgi:hypothetical protein
VQLLVQVLKLVGLSAFAAPEAPAFERPVAETVEQFLDWIAWLPKAIN